VTAPDPRQLARRLRETADLLDRHGALLLSRTWDWTVPPRQGDGHRFTRGGGLVDPDGAADDNPRSEDRREDQQASAYHAEVKALALALDSGCNRLIRVAGIVMPDPPRDLTGGEVGCWSCARTEVRPGVRRWNEVWRTVRTPEGVARPMCRPCAERVYRTEKVPTVGDVGLFHETGRWPRERASA
jgi:hypothetical protein